MLLVSFQSTDLRHFHLAHQCVLVLVHDGGWDFFVSNGHRGESMLAITAPDVDGCYDSITHMYPLWRR